MCFLLFICFICFVFISWECAIVILEYVWMVEVTVESHKDKRCYRNIMQVRLQKMRTFLESFGEGDSFVPVGIDGIWCPGGLYLANDSLVNWEKQQQEKSEDLGGPWLRPGSMTDISLVRWSRERTYWGRGEREVGRDVFEAPERRERESKGAAVGLATQRCVGLLTAKGWGGWLTKPLQLGRKKNKGDKKQEEKLKTVRKESYVNETSYGTLIFTFRWERSAFGSPELKTWCESLF